MGVSRSVRRRGVLLWRHRRRQRAAQPCGPGGPAGLARLAVAHGAVKKLCLDPSQSTLPFTSRLMLAHHPYFMYRVDLLSAAVEVCVALPSCCVAPVVCCLLCSCAFLQRRVVPLSTLAHAWHLALSLGALLWPLVCLNHPRCPLGNVLPRGMLHSHSLCTFILLHRSVSFVVGRGRGGALLQLTLRAVGWAAC